jgi:alkylation response protein AidB-like acyl-CoA dehydrogenase
MSISDEHEENVRCSLEIDEIFAAMASVGVVCRAFAPPVRGAQSLGGKIVNFALPKRTTDALAEFEEFIDQQVSPNLSAWVEQKAIPRGFFRALGQAQWLGFRATGDHLEERPYLEQAVLVERLARISPGVAVAVLVQVSLGQAALLLFGSTEQKRECCDPAALGQTLICLGNTESAAGSDVAALRTRAQGVDGGWVLDGTKAYVTNGSLADRAVVTAVSDPDAPSNQRLSLFLVDLSSVGVSRAALDKRVWIPSDLTRIDFRDVFLPQGCLVGTRGRGLQEVLEIFSRSRVLVAALTLGTAVGAFELGLEHAVTRKAFGKRLVDFEAKAFEAADGYARLEAARLALWKACWLLDEGEDFRAAASVAKYLAVEAAQDVTRWAADLFGAASVVFSHPIHKYPMDAWASSLGEGTQDIQKLVIYRELMKERGYSSG